MDEDRGGSALRIALCYALFGVGWIFFTDLAAEQWASTEAQLRRLQTAKGWLFILASAALIHFLVRLHDRRRRDALRRARESEQRMRRAQWIARMGNWEYDLRTEHLYWSDEIYEIFGIEPDWFQETREAFYEFVHPDDVGAQKEADRALIAGEGPLDHEHRIVRPDGEVRHVHERAVLERDEEGEPVRVSGTVQDVTERRLLERELERSRSTLQRYAGYLIRGREHERRALAREIHDELGQTLTALRIELGQLAVSGRGEGGDAERIRASLDLTGEAMRQVRGLVTGLRPGVLEELGLEDALRHLVEQYAENTGREVTVDLPEGRLDLDRDRAIHVYRVAQEALTNVARHADADRVRLRLRVQEGVVLELRVADDGRGFGEPERESAEAHGLTGMEERAHLLGGELRLGESEEGGAEVALRVPLGGAGGAADLG